MPTPCSICKKPDILEINCALVRDGTRDTARQFSLSVSALDRHKKHLPAQLVRSEEARKISNSDDLLAHAQRLLSEVERLGRKAEESGFIRVAPAAIGEQRNVLKLLGEVLETIKAEGGKDEPTLIIVDI